jgi:hypothetical protein
LAWQQRVTDLDAFVRQQHPRYLVYTDRGPLQEALRLPPRCSSGERGRGMELDCIYANEVYRIYAVHYP